MILTRTPYRVSLFGGGSDYPEHFNAHGGAVLGMAINKYVYIGVKPAPPGQGPRFRVAYSRVEDAETVDQIQHPAVRGCLRHLGIDSPLEIHYSGDLASGGGLGASSAFVVGLLHALRWQFFPQGASQRVPTALANEAIHVERDVIGEAVGYQDQIFAARGGLRFHRFQLGTWRSEEIPLRDDYRAELERSLVLVYSGTMRFAHVMAAKQLTLVKQNEADLCGLTALALGGADLLRGEQDLSGIGALLRSTWERKRRLHPEISTPEIDALYARGMSLGASGGKLCGAGGGGFLLFFVPLESREYFERHIGASCVGFKIAPRGSHVLVNEP